MNDNVSFKILLTVVITFVATFMFVASAYNKEIENLKNQNRAKEETLQEVIKSQMKIIVELGDK